MSENFESNNTVDNIDTVNNKNHLNELKNEIESTNVNIDIEDHYEKMDELMTFFNEVDFKGLDEVATLILSNHILLLCIKYKVTDISVLKKSILLLLKEKESTNSNELWEFFDNIVSKKEIKWLLNNDIEEIIKKYKN